MIFSLVSCDEPPMEPKQYTVTFETGCETEIKAVKVAEGEKVSKPEILLTKEGFTFAGWTLEDAIYDFDTPVKADITLVAKWDKVEVPPVENKKFTVTFDTDGGSEVASVEVVEGDKVTKPVDPTKEGFTFEGWYLGENAYDN